jgi:peptidoglycan/LPS O-acetylase OafA/YrhL
MNKKISDIEVLRGIAVIFVCIEHLNMNLIRWGSVILSDFFSWTGMWSGVDLFFVISGFVIARDLIPRLQDGTSKQDFYKIAVPFWIRRIWRLVPSAWLWLAVILVCSVFFNNSGAWGSFRANLEGGVAAILNVANLRTWMVYGEYEVGATFPYWSLSLEEQFYLIFPFLIFFSGKKLPYILVALVVLQLVVPRLPLAIILRTDALALGVLIALFEKSEIRSYFNPSFLSKSTYQYPFIFLLIVCLAVVGGEDIHIPLEFSLVAGISAILVFIASFDRSYILKDGFLKVFLVWIGARSYAIYLIHIPAYFATREIWYRLEPPNTVFDGSYTLEFFITATLLIVVFAELNFRLIETPLRRHGANIAHGISK